MTWKVFVVTGPSTAGKTTLCTELRKANRVDLSVVDIDDEQPPQAGLEFWRRYRIEQLLEEAYTRDGDTLLCGALWPDQVLASSLFDGERTSFVILNLAPELLYTRLLKRFDGREGSDFQGLFWSNNYLRTGLLRQAAGLRCVSVLDVTELSRAAVAATVSTLTTCDVPVG